MQPINRLPRESFYMAVALLTSLRSSCQRMSVGCIVVKEGRIISMGYNGDLPASEGCNDITCNVDTPCTIAVHAEANAIAWAAKEGLALRDSIMYCTHLPCPKCAELIVQAGIRKVIYMHEYRDISGLEKFRLNGVAKEQIPVFSIAYNITDRQWFIK